MPLPPWTKRDNFSAAAHQRLVDGLNALAQITGTGDLEILAGPGGLTVSDSRGVVVAELVFGEVTNAGPNGESNFTDARYWIQKKRASIPASPTTATSLVDETSPEGDMVVNGTGDAVPEKIVMATNIASDSSHSLAVGTRVLMVAVIAYDPSTGGREKRYLLVPTSAGGVFDAYKASTLFQGNNKALNIGTARGTNNIITFTSGTFGTGGDPGVSIEFASGGANRQVLQIGPAGTVIWDYVRTV